MPYCIDGSVEIVPTLDRGIADVQADIPEHYLQLLRDAPLLLAEVKRLREGIIDIANKWEQPSIIRGFLKELKELIE